MGGVVSWDQRSGGIGRRPADGVPARLAGSASPASALVPRALPYHLRIRLCQKALPQPRRPARTSQSAQSDRLENAAGRIADCADGVNQTPVRPCKMQNAP